MAQWNRRAALAAGAAAVAGAALAQPASASFDIEGSDAWRIEGEARRGHARIDSLLGRRALMLRGGSHVMRKGVDLADGIIGFDMAPLADGDFLGVTFRREGFSNHENVYFRLRRSGDFMAVQYAPRWNGSSTWQLYPDFCRAARFPVGAWTPVRLEFRGSTLKVWIGDATDPVLTVPRLRHRSARGEIALWGRVNNKPEVWAVGVSNVRIEAAAPGEFAAPQAAPPGYIPRWSVSAPQAAQAAPPPDPNPGAAWREVAAEESGLVNLNRVIPIVPDTPRTVWARALVRSPATKAVKLGVGYSDDATAFVNGRPVFAGRNGFDSRYPGFASFVDARYEEAWVTLREGENQIMLAVTDDQRFGWGLAARFNPEEGIEL